MSQTTDDEATPETDRMHDNSWSVNLEEPRHADDRELVVEEAVAAVEHTTAGNHVNVVTHQELGHPSTYLYPVIHANFGEAVSVEYVDQCGCGGHVSRVHVE